MNTPQKSQNELDKRESNLKLLKGQIRDIAQNLKITLHKDKDRSSTKKGNFAELLAESDELFAKRAIVFDIESFTKKIGGLDEMVIQLNCKYGLQDKIQNLNSFLDFCAIHGFIPMIDKILIEGKDVSAIKELYSLFFFALFERDWLISNMMANEIEKLEKSTQKPAREILNHISKITEYTSKTYQDLLGKGAEKLKNPGVISENVFAEVALRIENEVRDKVGIESSYIKLANYADDTQKKTDMNFVIKRTPKHNYTVVPTQFTIAANGGLRGKKEDVENFLFSQLKKGVPMRDSFLLLAVNGKFKSAFASSKVGEGAVKEYADWLDSTTEREKSWGSSFPLFIDTIDQDILHPAEVMYIALHLLYKKYDFRYTEKQSYLSAVDKRGKIDRVNRTTINNVQLSEVVVEDSKIQKLERDGVEPAILRHEYTISYGGADMGTVVIYKIG